MTEQKEQKSNAIKNNNPKIGRPAKTDQEQQFKAHYLQNRKKFELECELLVYIHHIFFDEIPTHPTNQRVTVGEMIRLFEINDCMDVYRVLAKLNQNYFKSSSMFPEQKLKYTSLIDVSYMMRQIRIERGNKINSYQLILLVFFFLFNQKVVNSGFYDYFQKRVEIFRNGMINGPDTCQFNKMDTLIVALGLEVAIRQGMLIEEQVQDEENEENVANVEPQLNQMEVQNYPEMQSEQEESQNPNLQDHPEVNSPSSLRSIYS